jgi:isoleucyl-tRNA synthetase
VQNLRKEMDLAVTDRIKVYLSGSDKLKTAWESFAPFVASETLAQEVKWGAVDGQIPLEAGTDLEPAESWLVKIEKA